MKCTHRDIIEITLRNITIFYVLKFSNELLFFFFDLSSNKNNWAFDKVLYPVMFNGLPWNYTSITGDDVTWFERELLIQSTDNLEWKAQSLRWKWRKSEPNELMNKFFGISKRKKLYCNLTRQKFWSQVKKKKLTSSYLRTGVRNKDFVQRSSIGLE